MSALVADNRVARRMKGAAAMLLAALLAGAGLLTATAPAQAAEVWLEAGGVGYTADSAKPEDGATAAWYFGDRVDVTILSRVTIDGVEYPVTSIGDYAFSYQPVASIAIPDSVTSIGDHAFFNNRGGSGGLTSLALPSSLTRIGDFAFAWNHLTELTIPDSVTDIGDWAFYANALTSLELSESLTEIGESVFGLNLLTSVTIPDTVTTIGAEAFAQNRVSSVTIPASVTHIEHGAFFMHDWLKRVDLRGPAPTMGTSAATEAPFGSAETNGDLTLYYPKRYEAASESEGYTAPTWKGYASRAVATVAFDANGGSGSMAAQSSSVPSKLDANAFTRDGFRFSGWNTEADGSGVAYADAGEYLFADDATLYAQWTGIPPVLATIDHLDYVARAGKAAVVGYDGPSGAGITIPRQVTIGGETFEVTSIGESAFSEKGITSVTIPDTVTAIGQMAFQRNRLTSLTIPDSVRTIGREAFADNWLTSLTISASLGTIENGVFLGNRLTSVVIPDSVTAIGVNAFWANQLTSVVFSDSLTTIGAYAFGYNDIVSVTIPAAVTEIGFAAFGWGGKAVKRVDFLGPAPELEMTSDGGPFGTGGLGGAVLYFPQRYADTGYVGGAWHGYTSVAGYTVSFDAHGGAGRMECQNVPANSAIRVNAFTRNGYAFTGWNTAEDGSGTAYADRAPGAFDADTTLYAQWERIVITFTEVRLSGSAKVGGRLNAIVAAEQAAGYRYRWLRNGEPIGGATSGSYAPKAADRGARLSVEVTASAPELDTVTKTSATVTIGSGSLSGATPRISGMAKIGKKLRVRAGAWTAGTRLSYQWYLNGKAVRGATKAGFKIPKAAKGKKVSVRVTGTQPGYAKLVKTSRATSKVR